MTAPPRRPQNRAVIVFAVVAVLVAVGTIGLYLYRRTPGGREHLAGTPDAIVGQFLYNVFGLHDADQVAIVVCSSWPPADAISRTVSMVGGDAKVFWRDITVATTSETRASVTAQVGARLPDDRQATSYHGWRFNLVDENGWRVCDAEPLVV